MVVPRQYMSAGPFWLRFFTSTPIHIHPDLIIFLGALRRLPSSTLHSSSTTFVISISFRSPDNNSSIAPPSCPTLNQTPKPRFHPAKSTPSADPTTYRDVAHPLPRPLVPSSNALRLRDHPPGTRKRSHSCSPRRLPLFPQSTQRPRPLPLAALALTTASRGVSFDVVPVR